MKIYKKVKTIPARVYEILKRENGDLYSYIERNSVFIRYGSAQFNTELMKALPADCYFELETPIICRERIVTQKFALWSKRTDAKKAEELVTSITHVGFCSSIRTITAHSGDNLHFTMTGYLANVSPAYFRSLIAKVPSDADRAYLTDKYKKLESKRRKLIEVIKNTLYIFGEGFLPGILNFVKEDQTFMCIPAFSQPLDVYIARLSPGFRPSTPMVLGFLPKEVDNGLVFKVCILDEGQDGPARDLYVAYDCLSYETLHDALNMFRSIIYNYRRSLNESHEFYKLF